MNINQVMIYGNLTRDPEMKTLPSGIAVTNFSVATNRSYKDRDGNYQDETEFHNVTVFGRQAETSAQYLMKGAGAFIEGRLQTRSWEKDGVKHYRTEIVANRVQFGPKRGSEGDEYGSDWKKDKKYNPNGTEKPDGPVHKPAPVKDNYPEEDIDPADIPF